IISGYTKGRSRSRPSKKTEFVAGSNLHLHQLKPEDVVSFVQDMSCGKRRIILMNNNLSWRSFGTIKRKNTLILNNGLGRKSPDTRMRNNTLFLCGHGEVTPKQGRQTTGREQSRSTYSSTETLPTVLTLTTLHKEFLALIP
ncbi:hypothetical protein Dimus_032325, partial [Dionaea muscipula]